MAKTRNTRPDLTSYEGQRNRALFNDQKALLDPVTGAIIGLGSASGDYNTKSTTTNPLAYKYNQDHNEFNESLAADYQTTGQKLGNAFKAQIPIALGNTVGYLNSIADVRLWFDSTRSFEDSFQREMSDYTERMNEKYPVFRKDDKPLSFEDPGWWASVAPSLVGSMFSFWAAGTITALGLRGLGASASWALGSTKAAQTARTLDAAIKGSKVANAAVETGKLGLNAYVMSNAESVQVGIDIYKEIYDKELQKTGDAEKAKEVASYYAAKGVQLNRFNTLLNVTSAARFIKNPYNNAFLNAVDDPKKGWRKYLVEGGQEYAEENVNEIASDYSNMAYEGAPGGEIFRELATNMVSGRYIESGLLGFVGGAGMTALQRGYNKTFLSVKDRRLPDGTIHRGTGKEYENYYYDLVEKEKKDLYERAGINSEEADNFRLTENFSSLLMRNEELVKYYKEKEKLEEEYEKASGDTKKNIGKKLEELNKKDFMSQLAWAMKTNTLSSLEEIYKAHAESDKNINYDEISEEEAEYAKQRVRNAKTALDVLEYAKKIDRISSAYENKEDVFIAMLKAKTDKVTYNNFLEDSKEYNIDETYYEEQLQKGIDSAKESGEVSEEYLKYFLEEKEFRSFFKNKKELSETLKESLENVKKAKSFEAQKEARELNKLHKKVTEKIKKEKKKEKAKKEAKKRNWFSRLVNKNDIDKAVTESETNEEDLKTEAEKIKTEKAKKEEELRKQEAERKRKEAQDLANAQAEEARRKAQEAQEQVTPDPAKTESTTKEGTPVNTEPKGEPASENTSIEKNEELLDFSDMDEFLNTLDDNKKTELKKVIQSVKDQILESLDGKSLKEKIKEFQDIIAYYEAVHNDPDITDEDDNLITLLLPYFHYKLNKAKETYAEIVINGENASKQKDINNTGEEFSPSYMAVLSKEEEKKSNLNAHERIRNISAHNSLAYRHRVFVRTATGKITELNNLVTTAYRWLLGRNSLPVGTKVIIRVDKNYKQTTSKGVTTTYADLVSKGEDFIPIGVYTLTGRLIAYIHIPSFITYETTSDSVYSLDTQIEYLRKIRKAVLEKGEIETTITENEKFILKRNTGKTFNDSFKPMESVIKGNEHFVAIKNNKYFYIGKNKKFNTPKRQIVNEDSCRPGIPYMLVYENTEKGIDYYRAVYLKNKKLTEMPNYIDSILNAVKIFMTGEDISDLAKLIKETHNLNIFTIDGLNKYVSMFTPTRYSTKGVSFSDVLHNVNEKAFIFRFGSDIAQFGLGKNIGDLKGIVKKDMPTDLINDTLNRLKIALAEAYFNPIIPDSHTKNFNIVINSEGNPKVFSFNNYQEFAQKGLLSYIGNTEIEINNKKEYPFHVQPMIRFDDSFVNPKAKPSEIALVTEKEETDGTFNIDNFAAQLDTKEVNEEAIIDCTKKPKPNTPN